MAALVPASIEAIARALGGRVRSGSEILCPGPGHSAHDRSLAVRFSCGAPEGFVVHSFAGDDPLQCRHHVRARLGLTPWEFTGKRKFGTSGFSVVPAAGADDRQRARIAAALRIWNEAVDSRELARRAVPGIEAAQTRCGAC